MAAIRILGRVALVALFICTLVAVALAQDNAAQTPAVVVDDQISTNNTVTVRQVTAPQAAFLVIQRDLVGVPGPVIGHAPVAVGSTENVVISLTEAVASGNLLYAALYVDGGQLGIFEVPGADAPFVLNDQTLAQPFTIAAASSDQQTPSDQAALSPLATVTTTVTATVTNTVITTVTATVAPTLAVVPTVAATPQGQQGEAPPTVQSTVQELQAQATPTEQPATPTVQPTAQAQVTPTASVDVQATASAAETAQQVAQAQQPAPGRPTPALMPVTGASATANLPTTLLIGALAFVLFVGGNRFLQRLRSR